MRKTVAETSESPPFANCQGNNFIPKEEVKSLRIFLFVFFIFLKKREVMFQKYLYCCWLTDDFAKNNASAVILGNNESMSPFINSNSQPSFIFASYFPMRSCNRN